MVDFSVCKSQYGNSVFIYAFSPVNIDHSAFFIVMLRTIDLYCKLFFGTIKIKNIFADYFLPYKSFGITAQEIIPQVIFFSCSFLPKFSGVIGQFHVVFFPHNHSSFKTGLKRKRHPLRHAAFGDAPPPP